MAQKKKTRKKAARPASPKKTSKKPAARKSTASRQTAAPGKSTAPRKSTRKVAKTRVARAVIDDAADPVARIQRVIDVMVAAGAVEVELEEAGTKLRVRLMGDHPVSVVPFAAHSSPGAITAAVLPVAGGGIGPAGAADEREVDDPKRQVFKSPMVGTFYRAPAPDADPYVEVSDRVGPDATLCILEAMKVMNEIKAEMSGEVVEILAQNGEPVEFGQPLFVIKVD